MQTQGIRDAQTEEMLWVLHTSMQYKLGNKYVLSGERERGILAYKVQIVPIKQTWPSHKISKST